MPAVVAYRTTCSVDSYLRLSAEVYEKRLILVVRVRAVYDERLQQNTRVEQCLRLFNRRLDSIEQSSHWESMKVGEKNDSISE